MLGQCQDSGPRDDYGLIQTQETFEPTLSNFTEKDQTATDEMWTASNVT